MYEKVLRYLVLMDSFWCVYTGIQLLDTCNLYHPIPLLVRFLFGALFCANLVLVILLLRLLDQK